MRCGYGSRERLYSLGKVAQHGGDCRARRDCTGRLGEVPGGKGCFVKIGFMDEDSWAAWERERERKRLSVSTGSEVVQTGKGQALPLMVSSY